MTKKHFIALADAIKKRREKPPGIDWGEVQWLADFCESQNPQFNRVRWLEYIYDHCGPNGGSINKHMDER